jgi:hypothetical protein
MSSLVASSSSAMTVGVVRFGSMTGGSYVDQLQRTAAMKEDALAYFGVALFGSADKISPLTRPLWK